MVISQTKDHYIFGRDTENTNYECKGHLTLFILLSAKSKFVYSELNFVKKLFNPFHQTSSKKKTHKRIS